MISCMKMVRRTLQHFLFCKKFNTGFIVIFFSFHLEAANFIKIPRMQSTFSLFFLYFPCYNQNSTSQQIFQHVVLVLELGKHCLIQSASHNYVNSLDYLSSDSRTHFCDHFKVLIQKFLNKVSDSEL